MSTLTVEIPDELASQLDAISGGREDMKASLVEHALRAFVDSGSVVVPRSDGQILVLEPFPDGQSFYDVTKDVCGKFEGPGDLSTNPKYMEGFGKE
jgi:hypothetical protein